MPEYKQILEEWYWNTKINLLVHGCSEIDKSHTKQIDSEIRCMRCKKEVPQAVVDICLLCNIKPRWVYKTIEGIWGIEKYYFNSNLYLAHWCRGEGYPYYCNSTKCGECNTKIPKHIIKYCKENNVPV